MCLDQRLGMHLGMCLYMRLDSRIPEGSTSLSQWIAVDEHSFAQDQHMQLIRQPLRRFLLKRKLLVCELLKSLSQLRSLVELV